MGILTRSFLREDSAKIINFKAKVKRKGVKSKEMCNNSPVSSLPDGLISLYTDMSQPLILQLQLFWFDDLISEFMRKVKVFRSRSGPIIMLSDHFKYEPSKMEGDEIIHLYGFASNHDSGAYDTIKILCNDEEKVIIKNKISNALQELAKASVWSVHPTYRSLRIRVGMEKT